MAIDIRATVTCSLGTLISASVSDDYVQGTGLIKCKGNCEISGLITPAIGTAVTFSYTKDGVTYDVPRTLRVLSSFADPFRRTTKVELGCKLTYLQDVQEPLTWDYTDDPDNSGVDPADSAIITIPISAASIAAECCSKLGIAGAPALSNTFSIAKFDFSAGYVSILSDLMVSECRCGYLDDTETLQTINLSAAGGTGPVFTSANVIDIAQIGVGQLPGDAVTVSYSSLKLNAPEPLDPDTEETQIAERNWEREEVIGSKTTVQVSNPFFDSNPFPVTVPEYYEYSYTPRTVVETAYDTLDRVTARTTTQYTILAELAPGYVQHIAGTAPVNGPSEGLLDYTIITTETFTYKVPAPLTTPTDEPPEGYQEVTKREQTVQEPIIKLNASTQIYDMAGQANVEFSYGFSNNARFIASKTVETPSAGTTQAGTPCTKAITETYQANGYTQKGQQALASSLERNKANGDFYGSLAILYLVEAQRLEWVSTETTINTGRDIGLQQRPSSADRINQTSAKGEGDAKPDPDNGWRTASESEIELALGSPLATRRITLSLPYAPDDQFIKLGSPPSVSYIASPSDAPIKARAYGKAQNMLLMGNRYGINVQMAPELMPAAPFSPFILQANGLSALYRTNGTSWTMSPDGILASTDALFWGAVGGTGTFWFPVAPGISSLPTTPAVVDGEMTVTTPVPVWNETVPIIASTVLGLTVESLPYALSLLTETEISTVVGVSAASVKLVNVPSVSTITLAAPVPRVAIGASVRPGVTVIALAAPVPVVVSGASVAVPSADIALAALVPQSVGIPATRVYPPVASITMAALAPTAGPISDPDFASVSLLLHMDGTNGSTTFTDNSSNSITVTASGNAQISTAQSKFGGASALFDGSGDYISASTNSVFQFGTGDFTIEMWARFSGISAQSLYDTIPVGGSGARASGFVLVLTAAGKLDVFSSSSFRGASSATLSANTWYHIALCRSGNTWSYYVDGSSAGGYTQTLNATNSTFLCGRLGDSASYYVNGHIDDLRVTKGVCRYTGAFTPPSAPFPND